MEGMNMTPGNKDTNGSLSNSHAEEAQAILKNRLQNYDKLFYVPVFALRELLESRIPDRKFGNMRQAELVALADGTPAITEIDVDELYENYRYGHRLSFFLYLLPEGLPKLDINNLQTVLDELAVLSIPDLTDEIAAREDYEIETSPDQITVLDEEKLDGVQEIRFRYFVAHRYLNIDEHPDQVFQTRYGFLWLDRDQGFLIILSRDEKINHLLTRALSKCLKAIPIPVRLPKELIDEHFPIEKIKRVSHYDPTTGIHRSISGEGLWQNSEKEILENERHCIRPSSIYTEEVSLGVSSGLGITASKGKIYLTRRLSASLIRTWGQQRLPRLVRDMKNQRTKKPDAFSHSIETINRMRLNPAGKAAFIAIIEAILQADREHLSIVSISQPSTEIFRALGIKYFDTNLSFICKECGEIAELCPKCESPLLEYDDLNVICRNCGLINSDGEYIVLRCLNGHIIGATYSQALSLLPKHLLQERVSTILSELGQSWKEQADYFYIQDTTLWRLQKGIVDPSKIHQTIINHITHFWGEFTGPVHSGSGDIKIVNGSKDV
jgi:hypothetical protein